VGKLPLQRIKINSFSYRQIIRKEIIIPSHTQVQKLRNLTRRAVPWKLRISPSCPWQCYFQKNPGSCRVEIAPVHQRQAYIRNHTPWIYFWAVNLRDVMLFITDFKNKPKRMIPVRNREQIETKCTTVEQEVWRGPSFLLQYYSGSVHLIGEFISFKTPSWCHDPVSKIDKMEM